jgi:hypothetical protein
MKHAGPDALDRLEPLLTALRMRALKEKSRGVFYRGSKAFLHFHEHGTELFADIRAREDFERMNVTRLRDRGALLKRVDALLKSWKVARPPSRG